MRERERLIDKSEDTATQTSTLQHNFIPSIFITPYKEIFKKKKIKINFLKVILASKQWWSASKCAG